MKVSYAAISELSTAAATPPPLTYSELNALRYTAGYICLTVRKRIKRMKPVNVQLKLSLNELLEEDAAAAVGDINDNGKGDGDGDGNSNGDGDSNSNGDGGNDDEVIVIGSNNSGGNNGDGDYDVDDSSGDDTDGVNESDEGDDSDSKGDGGNGDNGKGDECTHLQYKCVVTLCPHYAKVYLSSNMKDGNFRSKLYATIRYLSTHFQCSMADS